MFKDRCDDKQCLPRGGWGCFLCDDGSFCHLEFETVNWGVAAVSHSVNVAHFRGDCGLMCFQLGVNSVASAEGDDVLSRTAQIIIFLLDDRQRDGCFWAKPGRREDSS